MTARGRRRRLPRAYTKHGLTPLIQAVKTAGTGVLDRRTQVWRQLSAWWRARGVIEDRGEAWRTSTLELDAIDQLGKLKLIADSAVEVVLTLPTIYNKRNRSLLPVALQTMNAINSYLKAATALGLESRASPVPSLDEYLSRELHAHRGGGGQRGARGPAGGPGRNHSGGRGRHAGEGVTLRNLLHPL